MESFSHGNLCAALRTSTKTTTKIRKTTEENLFLDCINSVSCSAGACVKHSLEAMSDQIKINTLKGFGGREQGEMHIFCGLLLRKYCDRVVIFYMLSSGIRWELIYIW
jgi:hypothetical protein